MAEKLRIPQHEWHQPVWQAIKAHYDKRIAIFRAQLENPATPEAQRPGLVFRIDEIKKLLAAGEEQKNVAGAGE